MKIGITGGSGYIGSWLARRFIQEGEEVCLIDVSPPSPGFDLNKAEYVEADITDKDGILKAIKGCGVLYHLAAVVSKLRGVEDRYHCIKANIYGTLNVLEAARLSGVRRVIYMGTSEILGEPLFTPTDERHHRRPKTTYGITKCAGEDLCYEYFLTYGLNVVIPRLYMVYGIEDRRMIKYQNVIIKFIWNVLHDKPPVVFKECIRTFLYITDCIEALYLLKDKGGGGEIYDICDRPEYGLSMEELAQMIIRLCEKEMEPILQEPPPTDTKVKLPSGYKVRAELGWSPEVRLEEGLRRTVKWMKELYETGGLQDWR